jgi:hypothetical protein
MRMRILVVVALLAGCEKKAPPKPKPADSQTVTEVADVFGQIKVGQEQWRAESGEFLTIASEAQPDEVVAFAKLRVRPAAKPPLRCKYAAVAGGPDQAPEEPLGKQLYPEGAPKRAWFYMVARCGEYTFVQRSDSNEIVEKRGG